MFPSARDVNIIDSTLNNMAGDSNVEVSSASPMATTVNQVWACLLLALVGYILVKKIF